MVQLIDASRQQADSTLFNAERLFLFPICPQQKTSRPSSMEVQSETTQLSPPHTKKNMAIWLLMPGQVCNNI